jgi:hypothetical protein
MAHFLVRHPFGASIATAMLFKIVPDDFVEPKGSHQSLPAPHKTKGSLWEPFVLYGGERGIIRRNAPHLFEAAVANAPAFNDVSHHCRTQLI